MRQPIPAALLLVLVLLLAACGDTVTIQPVEDETVPGMAEEDPATASPPASPPASPADPTSDPGAADDLALEASCTNPDGFEVDYPAGWVTNEEPADELPPCSLFDPTSVELPDHLEVPVDIAVYARIDAVDFDDLDSGEERFAEVLDRREATVDGRAALRLEVEATGEGMYPEGQRTTRWAVDLGDGESLIATTHDVGEPDYATKQDVLDAMVERLRIDR